MGVPAAVVSFIASTYTIALIGMVFASVTPYWREVASHPVVDKGERGDVDVLVGLWRSCSQFEDDIGLTRTRCARIPVGTCRVPYFDSTEYNLDNCGGLDACRVFSVLAKVALVVLILCVRSYKDMIWPVVAFVGLLQFVFALVLVAFFSENELIPKDLPVRLGYSYWVWLGCFLATALALVAHLRVSYLSVGFLSDGDGDGDGDAAAAAAGDSPGDLQEMEARSGAQ